MRAANRLVMILTTLLDSLQAQTLRAVVECILPADDYPSGWESGADEYLVRLLTREPRFLFVYQLGLDALESEAKGFHRLSPDAQNAFLTQLEQDKARGAFFRLIVSHVLEGCYADPGNGGNRNMVFWQMIGYEVTA